ncbi:MAG: threonylcarbamoyl-AMP synthase [Clostridiales bacterium]|nr:threonylcarbamoyl-AMP synthase [Clostridiales bacterium]
MGETKLLSCNENDLEIASTLLRNGKIVGVPTETVYGLGADATNSKAVSSVFIAKGRPADNPLIVHISSIDMLERIAFEIPDIAYKLAEEFWGGPLTMVLKKKGIIPSITSGGLDTVGVRMPSHPIIKRIIELAGIPIAAPSANISGYPSPTTAAHVMNDMAGKISAVVDGGTCHYGIESTVISFDDFQTVRILRPGCVTKEDLEQVCKKVIIDEAVLSNIKDNNYVRSPGMKYKHYSPKANIVIINGSLEGFKKYISQHNGKKIYSLIYDKESGMFPYQHLTYGDNSVEHAQQLFSKLRELDKIGAETVYVRTPNKDGVGLAVYNRLIRAAGFEVIEL